MAIVNVYNAGESVEDKRDAQAHLNALESFGFKYCLITIHCSPLYLKEAITKLQGQSQDIASEFAMVEQCSANIQGPRDNMDYYSHQIFEHSCTVTE